MADPNDSTKTAQLLSPHEEAVIPNALTSEDIQSSITVAADETVADGLQNLQLTLNPDLLRLATETRLQILRNFVVVDRYKFCPHVRLPLLVCSPHIEQPFIHNGKIVPCLLGWNACGSSPRQRGLKQKLHREECFLAYLMSKTRIASVNEFTLSVLLVCQTIRAEAVEFFYTQNVFYFEQYLTQTSMKKSVIWRYLPTHLPDIPPKYLKMIKKIGFAVKDESLLDPQFAVWQRLCVWIRKNLPNLQHTYIFLFSPDGLSPVPVKPDGNSQPNRPSDRFLIRVIRFLDSIPGHKTIQFRGSNNSKRIVGNILAPHFRGRDPESRTISVVGGCRCLCWSVGTPLGKVVELDLSGQVATQEE
ncbi:MAG: hypothetical protein Q9178_005116 [Gyalolechia marmorata]